MFMKDREPIFFFIWEQYMYAHVRGNAYRKVPTISRDFLFSAQLIFNVSEEKNDQVPTWPSRQASMQNVTNCLSY